MERRWRISKNVQQDKYEEMNGNQSKKKRKSQSEHTKCVNVYFKSGKGGKTIKCPGF